MAEVNKDAYQHASSSDDTAAVTVLRPALV